MEIAEFDMRLNSPIEELAKKSRPTVQKKAHPWSNDDRSALKDDSLNC